jgi:hypothetical protein
VLQQALRAHGRVDAVACCVGGWLCSHHSTRRTRTPEPLSPWQQKRSPPPSITVAVQRARFPLDCPFVHLREARIAISVLVLDCQGRPPAAQPARTHACLTRRRCAAHPPPSVPAASPPPRAPGNVEARSLLATELAELDRVVKVNLHTQFNVLKASVKARSRGGGQS